MGWRAARQAADVEGPPPVLYLDCRAKDMSTPAELAKHLREIVTGNPSIVTLVTKMLQTVKSLTAKQGAVTFSVDVDAMFSEHRDVTPVASVIASYTELLDLFKASRYKPIIFIDEANVLQGWREAGVGAPELEKLLRFFVKITKQDNAAHVVLATSSSFLEGWLRGRKCAAATHPCLLCPVGGGGVQCAHTCRLVLAAEGLDAKQFRVHVVGDLPEDEAQRYCCGGGGWPGLIMQSAADVPPGGLEAWPKVYAACGGNIGLLLRCVEGAKVEGDWDEGEAQRRRSVTVETRQGRAAVSALAARRTLCGSHAGREHCAPACPRPRTCMRCTDRCSCCLQPCNPSWRRPLPQWRTAWT
jgi:hypothetical protein